MQTGSLALLILVALAAAGAGVASAMPATRETFERRGPVAVLQPALLARAARAVFGLGNALVALLPARSFFILPASSEDARRMASIADANERQLLFVKTTRG